jgi:drug/metabolite transporter (DMT)-like permease
MGTVRTGYNALLTPAITVLLAAPQLGEPITAKKLIGLVLVVAGLLLIMPRARRSTIDDTASAIR